MLKIKTQVFILLHQAFYQENHLPGHWKQCFDVKSFCGSGFSLSLPITHPHLSLVETKAHIKHGTERNHHSLLRGKYVFWATLNFLNVLTRDK